MIEREEEEVTTELVVLPLGEKPPEEAPAEDPKVVELRNQVRDLSEKANSNEALRKGIEGLGTVLNRPAPQQTISSEPTEESQEEFDRKIEEELFKPGQTATTLRKAIQRIANEVLSPQISTAIGANVEQTKEMLRIDPSTKDNFSRFSAEIEAMVAGAPGNVRKQPNVYRLAYNEVMRQHAGELEEERTSAIVKKKLDELLEKSGMEIDDEGKVKKRESVYLESGGVRSGASATKTKKVYVQPTAEDIRIAKEHDYDVAEVVRLRLKRERGEL